MKFRLASLAALLAFVSAPALAETKEFTLTIKDHKFAPETLDVPAGQKIKIIVDNQDPAAEEFESEELKREKVIAANSRGVVVVGPLTAGIYPFFGEFNKATAQGKIIVK